MVALYTSKMRTIVMLRRMASFRYLLVLMSILHCVHSHRNLSVENYKRRARDNHVHGVAVVSDYDSTLFDAEGRHLHACGNEARSVDEVLETARQVQDFVAAQQQRHQDKRLLQNHYVIPVHFHVIVKSRNDNTTTALITKESIQKEINVMNSAFSDSPFSFTLSTLDYTVSTDWYTCVRNSYEEYMMHEALHVGDASEMNVYICDTDSTGLRGWSTFPWLLGDSFDERQDSVTITYQGIDGADTAGWWSQLLTHESGHWLGLYHTFENGCDYPGDGVEDTPAHASPSLTCETQIDTCADDLPNTDPGMDPIYNIMNGVPNNCRREFTPGQITRMESMYLMHRSSDTTYKTGAEYNESFARSSPDIEPAIAMQRSPNAQISSFTENSREQDCVILGSPCEYTSDCCGSSATVQCASGFCFDRRNLAESDTNQQQQESRVVYTNNAATRTSTSIRGGGKTPEYRHNV